MSHSMKRWKGILSTAARMNTAERNPATKRARKMSRPPCFSLSAWIVAMRAGGRIFFTNGRSSIRGPRRRAPQYKIVSPSSTAVSTTKRVHAAYA